MKRNAKEELKKTLRQISDFQDGSDILWAWVAINDVYRTLPINHTTEDFVDFMDSIDEYYDAKTGGCMVLEGVVVFDNGNWLERDWEQDDLEYWIPRLKPNMNDDFFFLETDERCRPYRDIDGIQRTK